MIILRCGDTLIRENQKVQDLFALLPGGDAKYVAALSPD
jgi:hypothetical protein